MKKTTKKLLLPGCVATLLRKAAPSSIPAKRQKFFASFFQKRRPCLPPGATASRLLAFGVGTMIQVGCTQPVVQDAAADGRFDGVYAGTRTQDAACGSLHQAVVFHVAGSRITVESRHKRRRLSGTVSAGGEVALSDYSGGRQITGTIGNGRIVATEAVSVADNGKHQESGQNDPAAPSCLWRFEAVRTVGPAPEGAQE